MMEVSGSIVENGKNTMSLCPTTPAQWQRHHFEVEREFARRLLLTPKASVERHRLFEEAYSTVIGEIIERYSPGGGETHYTDVVVAIVRRLVPRGGRVLDVGCGGGALVEGLLEREFDAHGIDVSRSCTQRARKRMRAAGGADRIVQGDILEAPIAERFDGVVLDNTIEHFVPDSIGDVLTKCYRLLKPGGHVVVLTPHRFSGPHDVSRHFLQLGEKAQGFHLREFSFAELDEELRHAGFETVLGFPIHPRLLRSWKLVPRPSRWAAAKARGLERIFAGTFLRRALTLNTTFSRILVALLFPSIVVGQRSRFSAP
jgi:2-polyprenyl-3-methyl-5-hydroxy-6-metoxy-1,4-benzoquinol methylase